MELHPPLHRMASPMPPSPVRSSNPSPSELLLAIDWSHATVTGSIRHPLFSPSANPTPRLPTRSPATTTRFSAVSVSPKVRLHPLRIATILLLSRPPNLASLAYRGAPSASQWSSPDLPAKLPRPPSASRPCSLDLPAELPRPLGGAPLAFQRSSLGISQPPSESPSAPQWSSLDLSGALLSSIDNFPGLISRD